MAGGNNVSESTVRRWRDELIALLRRAGAAPGPRPEEALQAGRGGVVLIDGTLIHTQRRTGRADRRNYSRKHRSHGLHFLALTDEKGCLIWISAARPGHTHDNTAALTHLRAVGPGALADLGFRGLDNDISDPVIVTGYAAGRTHKRTAGQKTANRVLAVGRAPVEHGFAHLKNWRILAKLRTDPARAARYAGRCRGRAPKSSPGHCAHSTATASSPMTPAPTFPATASLHSDKASSPSFWTSTPGPPSTGTNSSTAASAQIVQRPVRLSPTS